MRAVFLDVDGVLNCQSTKEHIPGTKIRGIDFQKVQILKRITELYPDTVIILTSTWKDTWQPGGGHYADARYLEETLKKAGLRIEAKTEDDWIDRGAGIRRYLEAHPEIESFVILDDEVFDYEEQGLMPHVIRTSWQYIGGLREKHVKQAEEILKREARKRLEEMVEQEAWKGPEEILKRDARNRPAEGGTGAGTGTGTGILYGVGVGPGDPELLSASPGPADRARSGHVTAAGALCFRQRLPLHHRLFSRRPRRAAACTGQPHAPWQAFVAAVAFMSTAEY